jgi:hypothetical protein
MNRGIDWALRAERALWRYDIGLSQFNMRLPMDWADVATEMADVLKGRIPLPKRARAAEVARPGVG